jgi:hypothetical protein
MVAAAAGRFTSVIGIHSDIFMTGSPMNSSIRKFSSKLAITASMLGAVSLSSATVAHAQETGVSGRLWVGVMGRYVLSDNTPFTSPGFGTVALKTNGTTVAFGGDLELRMNNWFGIDAAAGYSQMNAQFTTSTSAASSASKPFGVLPLMASLNIHLIHSDPIDLWVGPQIAYVIFPNDLSYATPSGTFTYKPTNTFSGVGFVVGTDIKLGGAWALTGAVRWQNADSDGNDMLTVDPTFVTAGLRLKF